MIRLAAMKANGFMIFGNGHRYGRGRSGSRACSAARLTGANAYMIAVAPVTRLTSDDQLGNGRKVSSPRTSARMIDQIGTPRLFVCVSLSLIASSSPRAYDNRADVPT